MKSDDPIIQKFSGAAVTVGLAYAVRWSIQGFSDKARDILQSFEFEVQVSHWPKPTTLKAGTISYWGFHPQTWLR